MRFAVYNVASGLIQRIVTCEWDDIVIQLGTGMDAIELEEGDDSTHRVIDGEAAPLPPPGLDEQRAAKWEEVKSWRAAALVSPLLETPFGVFDADAASMVSIRDAVLGLREAAAIGAVPATICWTMANNGLQYLTPLQLSEVAALLLARGSAAYERARLLREAVDLASTAAELSEIVW